MCEVIEGSFEDVDVTIDKLTQSWIVQKEASEFVSIDFLCFLKDNFVQKMVQSLTEWFLLTNLAWSHGQILLPVDNLSNANENLKELITIKISISALFQCIGAHDRLIETFEHSCIVNVVWLKNTSLLSEELEVIVGQSWIGMRHASIEQESCIESLVSSLKHFFNIFEVTTERSLDLAQS